MLGNFSFLAEPSRTEVYGEAFSMHCSEAETNYAMGNYTSCIVLCRACCETLVKKYYAEPIFALPRSIGGLPVIQCDYAALLSLPEFRKATGDSQLVHQLNDMRRRANVSAHNMDHASTEHTALACLSLLHQLVLNFESHIFEVPVDWAFFTPSFDDPPDDTPIVRDYQTLMRTEADPELAAKWALLYRLDHPSFDLAPWIQRLDENADIRKLMEALDRPKRFLNLLSIGPLQLSFLVSRCYGSFHWSEIYAVTFALARLCRSYVNQVSLRILQLEEELSHG